MRRCNMIEAIVKLQDVTLTKRGNVILERINLEVFEHDYVGIIGPNGGGKTTLLRVILGLESPQVGQVLLCGQHPQKTRRDVGYVPQVTRVETNFPVTVIEVVMMGLVAKSKPRGRFTSADRAAALIRLEQVGMVDYAKRQIKGLSGGELQRVLIARAMISQPRLLLLDEPTANVDSTFGQAFYQLLAEINKNLAIIMVSHDIGVLASQVKTIACLNRELHYHSAHDIPPETMERIYGCPVDLIAHGHTHRVLAHHREEK